MCAGFDLDHLLAIDEVGAKGTSASLSRSTSKPVSRTAHTAGRGKPHVAIHEADFKDKSQKFVSEESELFFPVGKNYTSHILQMTSSWPSYLLISHDRFATHWSNSSW